MSEIKILSEIESVEASNVAEGVVASIVAAHLEPVTRFDRNDIRHLEPEVKSDLALTLSVKQSVYFETECHTGPRRLMLGTINVGGAAALVSQIRDTLARAEHEAADAMQSWVGKDKNGYRRVLAPQDTFKIVPGIFGYEYTCTNCRGACNVTCHACSGRGRNDCIPCGANGKINCTSCHGSKRLSCSFCRGQGNWSEQVSTQHWDQSRNMSVTNYHTENKSCGHCGASGKVTCYSCDYAGQVNCYSCYGRGYHNCNTCGSSGKVDCSTCLASGIEHEWATVRARIDHSEILEAHTEDQILHALVHEKLQLSDLPEFGELLDVQHRVSEQTLGSIYSLRLDVLRAPLVAAKRSFVVYGLGPEPTVVDFANLAGVLLEDDLVDLELKVKKASHLGRGRSTELIESTRRFVASELNLLIAEQVSDLKVAAEETNKKVEQNFKGLVDAAYIKRASKALRRAFGGIYGGALAEKAIYLCALATLVACLLFTFDWPHSGVWSAVKWSAGPAIVAWFMLEWDARRRIAQTFSIEVAHRVLQQISANGSAMRWRIGMMIALSASLATGLHLTQTLPWVQGHQKSQQMATLTERSMDNWAQQNVADFQLRSYPTSLFLRQRAEQGDSQARLVLVWQLLLGAGATKDVAGAAAWLAKAPANSAKDPLWRSAHALSLLNQESKPADIRKAAQELDQAANQGVIEARYWEARIYLAEQSPLHNISLGMKKLTQAADRGHAHAALTLGQRYAEGRDGIRRDLNKARHYLELALSQGLGEAKEMLKALR